MEENSNKYGKLVRISDPIVKLVGQKIDYPESFSDCLERLLGIKKKEKKNNASKRVYQKN